ncbi:Larval cuticle protein LCP-17 [Habropoda laboriosa]|uniref:Larval cuticle protein LCP-17 n=1 Tax=Habropoda laboriosa TaxID=597456 RepID=A0A0L7R062_9HYME|nr:PREDICTED: larval cuticle protein LCP-17-like [Habropoda laboriosa]KOC64259.1 Larval cuticle protein LCP-17 [Habropoda laboriosa]
MAASLALLAMASADVAVHAPPAVVKQSQDIAADGTYSFSYETENGIYHAENGAPVATDARNAPAIVAQGQYQYQAPDGTPISVSYIADHNGFQPQGDHIPPISPLIQRALEYIRAHPPKPEHDIVVAR